MVKLPASVLSLLLFGATLAQAKPAPTCTPPEEPKCLQPKRVGGERSCGKWACKRLVPKTKCRLERTRQVKVCRRKLRKKKKVRKPGGGWTWKTWWTYRCRKGPRKVCADEQPAARSKCPGFGSACASTILFWSQKRKDNFLAATRRGLLEAEEAGYRRIRKEGRLLSQSAKDTRPLFLYWHPGKLDNATVSDPKSLGELEEKGYQLVRELGYVLTRAPSAKAPVVGLGLWYSKARDEYFSTSSPKGARDARAAGYEQVRQEGFLLRP